MKPFQRQALSFSSRCPFLSLNVNVPSLSLKSPDICLSFCFRFTSFNANPTKLPFHLGPSDFSSRYKPPGPYRIVHLFPQQSPVACRAMLRHRNELGTPPHTLRRTQQSQHAGTPQSVSTMPLVDGLSGRPNQTLDLSICHPSPHHSNNRFSILATPSPSVTRPSSLLRELSAAHSHRVRHSRGTKEAKKRRDMRRNRRKLAAHLLDQQLNQAIDETIARASISAPPPPARACLLAAPSTLSRGLSHDTHRSAEQYDPLPSPPGLPLPKFSSFDLLSFPSTLLLAKPPPPVRVPTPFRTLPRWCPDIPSLTLGDVWRDCLPTFHDLSSLPEPVEPEPVPPKADALHNGGLQIWRPSEMRFGRDKSRFFPPRSLLTAKEQGLSTCCQAKVKLPTSVRCWLHASEDGGVALSPTHNSQAEKIAEKDVLNTFVTAHTCPSATFADDQSSVRHPTIHVEKEFGQCSPTVAERMSSMVDAATAVELWRDLELDHPRKASGADLSISSTRDASWEQPADASHCPTSPGSSYLPTNQPPDELDGLELALPYVHANSLTGYSNHCGTPINSLPNFTRCQISDSGIGLPIVRLSDDYNRDLNEPIFGEEVLGSEVLDISTRVPLPKSLPATPPATPPQHVCNVAHEVSITSTCEAEHDQSDAHFRSEQALFVQSPALTTLDTPFAKDDWAEQSSINISDFLKLGHAKHCWCDYCRDRPSDSAADGHGVFTSPLEALTCDNLVDDEDVDDPTLSLIFNPSQSEPDDNCEIAQLVDLVDLDKHATEADNLEAETTGSSGWLSVSSLESEEAPDQGHTPSSLYFPSSPILHRGRVSRAATPTIIITSSDIRPGDSSEEDTVTDVPQTATAYYPLRRSSWRDMLPRRLRSDRDQARNLRTETGVKSKFQEDMKESWKWEDDAADEWWNWTAEEEC